jgi:hypothetical protein
VLLIPVITESQSWASTELTPLPVSQFSGDTPQKKKKDWREITVYT